MRKNRKIPGKRVIAAVFVFVLGAAVLAVQLARHQRGWAAGTAVLVSSCLLILALAHPRKAR